MESFADDQSSPGVEQLQLLQPGEDWPGEIKDRDKGANTGEAEILQPGAERSQLQDVHLVKLLQVESPQLVPQSPEERDDSVIKVERVLAVGGVAQVELRNVVEAHQVGQEVVGEVGLPHHEAGQERTGGQAADKAGLADWALSKAQVSEVEDWRALLVFCELLELLGGEVLEDWREVVISEGEKCRVVVEELSHPARRTPSILQVEAEKAGTSWFDLALGGHCDTEVLQPSVSHRSGGHIQLSQMRTGLSDGVESFIVQDGSFNVDSDEKWEVSEESRVKCWLDIGGVSELQTPQFLAMFGE